MGEQVRRSRHLSTSVTIEASRAVKRATSGTIAWTILASVTKFAAVLRYESSRVSILTRRTWGFFFSTPFAVIPLRTDVTHDVVSRISHSRPARADISRTKN